MSLLALGLLTDELSDVLRGERLIVSHGDTMDAMDLQRFLGVVHEYLRHIDDASCCVRIGTSGKSLSRARLIDLTWRGHPSFSVILE